MADDKIVFLKRKAPPSEAPKASSSSQPPVPKKPKLAAAAVVDEKVTSEEICLAAVLFHVLSNSGTGTPFPADNMLAYAGQVVLLFVAEHTMVRPGENEYAWRMHEWIANAYNPKGNENVGAYGQCDALFARGFDKWARSQTGGAALMTALGCADTKNPLRISTCIRQKDPKADRHLTPEDIYQIHKTEGIPEQLRKLYKEKEREKMWRELLIDIVKRAQAAKNKPQILMSLVLAWHPKLTPLGLLADVLIDTLFFAPVPETDQKRFPDKIARVKASRTGLRYLMKSRPHTRGLFLWQLMSDIGHTNVWVLDEQAMHVIGRNDEKVIASQARVRPLAIRDRPQLFPQFDFFQGHGSAVPTYQSLLNVQPTLALAYLVPKGTPGYAEPLAMHKPLESFGFWLGYDPLLDQQQRKVQLASYIKHQTSDDEHKALGVIARVCEHTLWCLSRHAPTLDKSNSRHLDAVIPNVLTRNMRDIWPVNRMMELLVAFCVLPGYTGEHLNAQLRHPDTALMRTLADQYPSYVVSPVLNKYVKPPPDAAIQLLLDPALNYGTRDDIGGSWTQFAQTLGTLKCTEPMLKAIRKSNRKGMQCGLLILDRRYFMPYQHPDGAYGRLQRHLFPENHEESKRSSLSPLKTLDEVLGGTLQKGSNLVVWSEEVDLQGGGGLEFNSPRREMMSFACEELNQEEGNINFAHITLTRIADLLRAQYEFTFGKIYDGTLLAQAELLRRFEDGKERLCDFRVREYLEAQSKGLKTVDATAPKHRSRESLDEILGKVVDQELVVRAQKAAELVWKDEVMRDKETLVANSPEQIAMFVLLREGMRRQARKEMDEKVVELRQYLLKGNWSLSQTVDEYVPGSLKKVLKQTRMQRAEQSQKHLAELAQLAKERGVGKRQVLEMAMDVAPDEVGPLRVAMKTGEERVQRQREAFMALSGSELDKDEKAAQLAEEYETLLPDVEKKLQDNATAWSKLEDEYKELLLKRDSPEYKALNEQMRQKEAQLRAEAERLRARLERLKKAQEKQDLKAAAAEPAEAPPAKPLNLDLTKTIDAVCTAFSLPHEDYVTRGAVLRVLQTGDDTAALQAMAVKPGTAIYEWFKRTASRRFNLVRLALLGFDPSQFKQEEVQQKGGGGEGKGEKKKKGEGKEEKEAEEEDEKPVFPPLCRRFLFEERKLERTFGVDKDPSPQKGQKTKVVHDTADSGSDSEEEGEGEYEAKALSAQDSDNPVWWYALGSDAASAARAWTKLVQLAHDDDDPAKAIHKYVKRGDKELVDRIRMDVGDSATKEEMETELYQQTSLLAAAFVADKWTKEFLTMSPAMVEPEMLGELYTKLYLVLKMTFESMPRTTGDQGEKASQVIKALGQVKADKDDSPASLVTRAYALVSVFEWCQWCHALLAMYKKRELLKGVWAGAFDSCVDGATACVPRHRGFQPLMTAHLELQVLVNFVERPAALLEVARPEVHATLREGNTERIQHGWEAYDELTRLPFSREDVLTTCKGLWPLLNYNNPRDALDVRLLSRFKGSAVRFRSPNVPYPWSPFREALEKIQEMQGGEMVKYPRWQHDAWFDLGEAMRTEIRCIQVCLSRGTASQTQATHGEYLFISLMRLAYYMDLYRPQTESKGSSSSSLSKAQIRQDMLKILLGLGNNIQQVYPRKVKLSEKGITDPREVLYPVEAKLRDRLRGLVDQDTVAFVGWVYGTGLDDVARTSMVGHGAQSTSVGQLENIRRGELARRSTSPAFVRYLFPTAELYWYAHASTFVSSGLDVDVVNLACRLFASLTGGEPLVFLDQLTQYERRPGDVRSLAELADIAPLLQAYEANYVYPLWNQLTTKSTPIPRLEFLESEQYLKAVEQQEAAEAKRADIEPTGGGDEGDSDEEGEEGTAMTDDNEPTQKRQGKSKKKKRQVLDESEAMDVSGDKKPPPPGGRGGAEPMDTKGRVRMFRG